jgi:hypothetical protein
VVIFHSVLPCKSSKLCFVTLSHYWPGRALAVTELYFW